MDTKYMVLVKLIRVLSEIVVNPDCLYGYNELIKESHISAVVRSSGMKNVNKDSLGGQWMIKLDLKNSDSLIIDYDENEGMDLTYNDECFSIFDKALYLFYENSDFTDNCINWLIEEINTDMDIEYIIND